MISLAVEFGILCFCDTEEKGVTMIKVTGRSARASNAHVAMWIYSGLFSVSEI